VPSSYGAAIRGCNGRAASPPTRYGYCPSAPIMMQDRGMGAISTTAEITE
jgi:hypothetical protein